eukprot:5334463-Pyramimonas_sp.AAC.1
MWRNPCGATCAAISPFRPPARRSVCRTHAAAMAMTAGRWPASLSGRAGARQLASARAKRPSRVAAWPRP